MAKKFVPLCKQQKKAQKEHNNKSRVKWSMNPRLRKGSDHKHDPRREAQAVRKLIREATP